MKKILILLSFSFVLSFHSYSQLSRGCFKEQRDTTLTRRTHFSKSSDEFPSSYSLEKFAPPVMSQGNLSSCTAWSSAYCGLTIVKRMETGNLNNEAFSPLNLYNRLKAVTSEDPCHAGGCYVSDALNMLEDHGCAKFNDIANSCGYTSASKYYTDKLYGFEELGVTADNIKTALVKNSPVVFVIQYYNDGWGEEKNLVNGVWNGYYGSADGYHAMCIIGYDDNVGGGAFLVQNSWGDDWGKNGLFWIKYKDLFHIDQAFMLKADPSKMNESFVYNNTNGNNTNNNNNTNDDNTNNNSNDYTDNSDNTDNTDNDNTNNNQDNSLWNGSEEQVFRVYNECSVTAYVALAQYEDGAWVNRGWYATQPGRYIDLEIGNRGQDDIYWLAINNSNDLVWQDSENGTDMCYDPTDAFTIYDNANPDCPKYKKFFKESPGFEYEVYTQTLTCPSLDGGRDNDRGRDRDNNRRRDLNNNNTDNNSLGTNVLDHRHDDRDADVANYSWQKGTLLFDLYSKNIIHSTTNRNGDTVYHIFYIDSNNEVREGNLTEDRLANLQAYKFETRENAERWLSSK